MSTNTTPECFKFVKLIHAKQLQEWTCFPRYQEVAEAITLWEWYQAQTFKGKEKHADEKLVKLNQDVAAMDTDELVLYRSETITVPSTCCCCPCFQEPTRTLPVSPGTLEGTEVRSNAGQIIRVNSSSRYPSWVLVIPAPFLVDMAVTVEYEASSAIVHQEEIEEKQQEKRDMIEQNPLCQPIMFISHRWATPDHPDPAGEQLKKLQKLTDCYIIYDYASFPQRQRTDTEAPRTPEEQSAFEEILKNMNRLIKNVVVLSAPDFMERSWCLYEYIVASLHTHLITDEVRDPRLLDLHKWSSTKLPRPTYNLAYFTSNNSPQDMERGMAQNYINENIVHAVNRVLPLFQNSSCTNDDDRDIVRQLLVKHLRTALPKKRVHDPVAGWRFIPWSEEELDDAFERPVQPNEALHTQQNLVMSQLLDHITRP